MSNKTSTSLPQRVQLDEADLRTGIAMAHAAAQAQARLSALADMERVFATEMQRKYGIDPEKYHLDDWITGFERIGGADGNQTD